MLPTSRPESMTQYITLSRNAWLFETSIIAGSSACTALSPQGVNSRSADLTASAASGLVGSTVPHCCCCCSASAAAADAVSAAAATGDSSGLGACRSVLGSAAVTPGSDASRDTPAADTAPLSPLLLFAGPHATSSTRASAASPAMVQPCAAMAALTCASVARRTLERAFAGLAGPLPHAMRALPACAPALLALVHTAPSRPRRLHRPWLCAAAPLPPPATPAAARRAPPSMTAIADANKAACRDLAVSFGVLRRGAPNRLSEAAPRGQRLAVELAECIAPRGHRDGADTMKCSGGGGERWDTAGNGAQARAKAVA